MTFGTSDRTRPARPRPRSRARFLLPLAVLGWVALEIWLFTLVGGIIGGGWVLLALLAGLVLGGLAVRHAGRRAWNSLTAAMRSAAAQADPDGTGAPDSPERVPQAEGAGTAMLGGLLLMVPGFASDALGLLCLFPPTRKLLGAAGARVGRRIGQRGDAPPGSLGDALRQARMRQPDGKVVQGEVVRDDERPGPGGSGGAPKPPLTP